MEIWIIIALCSLLLSALFSGVEIAFVSADRVRAELDLQKGGIIAKIVDRYINNSDFFISMLLVGNNIVLVIYGMAAAALLEPWLAGFCPNDAMILICQTLISTAVILLTGEFLPKTIFRINPNTSLNIAAVPMLFFYVVLYPVAMFSTWISGGLMKLCGIKPRNDQASNLSIIDLDRYIERTIDSHEDTGQETMIENEVKIFHNAIDFSNTHLRDCMIPRNEIVAVNRATTTREQLSELFTRSGRSKIIVYDEDIDNVLGYIHVSELFIPENDWTEHLKPVIFAPETLMADKMMRRLLGEKRSLAIVIDEFGGTAGMVTLEDLVEEILGDIQDEHDRTSVIARKTADGIYEFSGRIEIERLRDEFDLDIPESDDYQTLAGYLLHSTGTIPATGTTVDLSPYSFKILKSSATRLELIQVRHTAGQ